MYSMGYSPKMSTLLRGRAEVAHQAHNLGVVGSIPAPATIFCFLSDSCESTFFFLLSAILSDLPSGIPPKIFLFRERLSGGLFSGMMPLVPDRSPMQAIGEELLPVFRTAKGRISPPQKDPDSADGVDERINISA